MRAGGLTSVSLKLLEYSEENWELRRIERQLLAVLLRFAVGYYSQEAVRRRLSGKLTASDLDLLYKNCFCSCRQRNSKRDYALHK